jgi:CubicO group peptidase (beta-lactamase class C family)
MHVRIMLIALLSLTGAVHASGSAALAEEIREGAHAGIEAFVLLRNGKVTQQAAPAAFARKPPDIRSATKSITALLVGIAIDRGEIRSLDERVVDLLPEYAELVSADPLKARMTVRDLLTMRSGLDCDDWNPDSPGHEDRMYRKRDWLRFWASAPQLRAPGKRFSYCTGNVIALGRILAHASGQRLDDYAELHLFAPLGIRSARWATWNRSADTDSGGHLRIHPEDFAKIGQLVLDGGRHGDVQLVSSGWIAAMTTAHTDIPDRPQQYGYLWWVDQIRSPGLPKGRIWIAWGNGGNFLVLMPEQRAVAVFSGTRFNRPEALEPLLWVRDRILPELRDPQ